MIEWGVHIIKYPRPHCRDGMQRTDATISVKITEEMEEAIVQQLTYGDSKSAYIRESVAQRLERDGVVDDGGALLS